MFEVHSIILLLLSIEIFFWGVGSVNPFFLCIGLAGFLGWYRIEWLEHDTEISTLEDKDAQIHQEKNSG